MQTLIKHPSESRLFNFDYGRGQSTSSGLLGAATVDSRGTSWVVNIAGEGEQFAAVLLPPIAMSGLLAAPAPNPVISVTRSQSIPSSGFDSGAAGAGAGAPHAPPGVPGTDRTGAPDGASPDVTVGTPYVVDTRVFFTVSGGTDGKNYGFSCLATTNLGNALVAQGILAVQVTLP